MLFCGPTRFFKRVLFSCDSSSAYSPGLSKSNGASSECGNLTVRGGEAIPGVFLLSKLTTRNSKMGCSMRRESFTWRGWLKGDTGSLVFFTLHYPLRIASTPASTPAGSWCLRKFPPYSSTPSQSAHSNDDRLRNWRLLKGFGFNSLKAIRMEFRDQLLSVFLVEVSQVWLSGD